MSGGEIRGADTDKMGVVTVEAEGERLIQMLSVIASRAERNYDQSGEHSIVTIQREDGTDQMAHLLTTIEGDQETTVVQIDPRHVVQQEVVVGAPDVGLGEENAIPMMIQTIQASDLRLEDVHALQQQKEQGFVVPEPQISTLHTKMIFMTNYRDYNIIDVDGRIWIGERKKFMAPSSECKIVPVTDNTTGYKFEYQYRARGTVKRYEFKNMIIYFIGQISNERILALFYQTVFQLVTKLGKIDLDKEYTSGKRVLSRYYQGIAPSSARTIRTPVEKLTYMKLLFVGDVDEDEDGDIVMIEDDDLEPAKPSRKLKKSNIYKPSRKKYKKTLKANPEESPSPIPENQLSETTETMIVQIAEEGSLNLVESPIEFAQQQFTEGEENGFSYVDTPQQQVAIEAPSEKAEIQKIPKKRGRKPKSYYLQNPSLAVAHPVVSQRSSSKRTIKRPSKFSDYLDTRKRIKQDLLSDAEDDNIEGSEDEIPKKTTKFLVGQRKSRGGRQAFGRYGKAPEIKSSSPTLVQSEDTPEAEITPGDQQQITAQSGNETSAGSESSSSHHVAEDPAPPIAASSQSSEGTPKIVTRIVEAVPRKRGPGRPRKYPIIKDGKGEYPTGKITSEEVDELVLQKKKYPSCQFQRAQMMMKYLCQLCLTDHDNPVTYNEKGILATNTCHIVEPKRTFKDQASPSGTGVCSLMSLPTSLSVKVAPETKKLKVCTGQEIPMYTEFGPLVGILLNEDDIQTDTDLSHVWFLQQEEDGEKFFLYTGDENASNWCHYLDPVPPGNPHNMVMVLREEGIFFTTSRKIPAGQELKVLIPYFGNKSRPAASMTQTECLHCKRSFRNCLDYQKHYHIFHPGGFTKQKQKCRLCNRSFPSLKSLHQHMANDHDGQGAFECDKCSNSFPNPARLRIHMRDVHPPPEAAVSCDKCGKVYRSKRALANHNTNVHSEFKFACEICGKWFDRRGTLLRHQRLHSGQFSHHCPRCGKGFRDMYNLKVHTLTHSGIRPFSCMYCQNCSFSNRGCLRNHYQCVHNLTDDTMPELNRTIPFTMDAYSGNLSPLDKPVAPQINKRGNRVGRPKAVLVSTEPIVDLNSIAQSDPTTTEKVIMPKKIHRKNARLAQRQSILRPLVQESSEPKEVHLHIEEDSSMQVQQVNMEEGMAIDMPMVVEEVKNDLPESFTTQFVEAEQVADGDHCYYALNVDGQQVLVPATEEVCVIVENENTVTIPAGAEETVETDLVQMT